MPDLETWVLVVDGAPAGEAPCAVDMSKPSAVLEWGALGERLGQRWDAGPPPWSPRELLPQMAEHCRLAMTAHQRRGESDSVAHWMYQMLALDVGAPEWGAALGK